MEYSGAWGKLIHEKNLMTKISWNCPFKQKVALARGRSSTGGLSGAKSNSCERRQFDLRQMLKVVEGKELATAKSATVCNYMYQREVSQSNRWPVALQRHNTENSKQIFPGKKLRGLSPNFHIHVSVSDLYIPTIGLPVLLQENLWTDPGNIYVNHSQTHEWGNWD
jgi:hypothetical protein